MSGDVTVNNSGIMQAVNNGGTENTAVHQALATDPLLAEVDKVLAAVEGIPTAPGDESGARLRAASGLLGSGRAADARKTLGGVGAWVATLASSLGANLLAAAIRGE